MEAFPSPRRVLNDWRAASKQYCAAGVNAYTPQDKPLRETFTKIHQEIDALGDAVCGERLGVPCRAALRPNTRQEVQRATLYITLLSSTSVSAVEDCRAVLKSVTSKLDALAERARGTPNREPDSPLVYA